MTFLDGSYVVPSSVRSCTTVCTWLSSLNSTVATRAGCAVGARPHDVLGGTVSNDVVDLPLYLALDG